MPRKEREEYFFHLSFRDRGSHGWKSPQDKKKESRPGVWTDWRHVRRRKCLSAGCSNHEDASLRRSEDWWYHGS
ncbi:MAG: hypothetical protein ACYCYM_04865 [Saccharofermentanales bacterium]